MNPQTYTSVHAQFLPDSPRFDEQYMSYLSELWMSAVSSFVVLYQRPPSNLDDLIDGLGLAFNPDCVWPFDPETNIQASCEGGIIDGKIVYWQVTLANRQTKGQARYWDSYTTYNDPDTPERIVTATTTSTVVDPSLVEGQRKVMFTSEIIRQGLESVRPQSEDADMVEMTE